MDSIREILEEDKGLSLVSNKIPPDDDQNAQELINVSDVQ